MSVLSPTTRRLLESAAREALGREWPSETQIAARGRKIYLVGPPASGKSRIARAFWNRLTQAERDTIEIHTGHDPNVTEPEFFR